MYAQQGQSLAQLRYNNARQELRARHLMHALHRSIDPQ